MTIIITIALILLALATQIVSMFWTRKSATKPLLVLAVISSAGAILLAIELENRAVQSEKRTVTFTKYLEHIVRDNNKIPLGFSKKLRDHALSIAKQEGYSKVELHETAASLNSKYFGYVIEFIDPSATRPSTGYEELAKKIGYGHSFAFISRIATQNLILAFLKGDEIEAKLQRYLNQISKTQDPSNGELQQFLQGIVYFAYLSASDPNSRHDFQKHPDKYWIDLEIDEDNSITFFAKLRSRKQNEKQSRIYLARLDTSSLNRFVEVDVITRGGKIFYHLFAKFLSEWSSPDYLPVVKAR